MSAAQARYALPAGTVLRQYRIDQVIGQGGFGITYLAFDTDLQRKVAIKECFPRDFVARDGDTTVLPTSGETATDFDWALQKFLDEATTLARFKHPGIVQVLQILKGENNSAYMVLEFVDGQSFDAWLKGLDRTPAEQELAAVIRPILDALKLVHDNNLAHRDIAPDNIYIRDNGDAVLLDFGAAKHTVGNRTRSINLVVKDGYSAPEQYYAEGRQGPWTDIYALSATLYRAIQGTRPVDSMARLDALQNDLPDPLTKLTVADFPGFAPAFLAGVHAGLAPQSKNRPQDIDALRQLLLPTEHAEATVARKTPAPTASSTLLDSKAVPHEATTPDDNSRAHQIAGRSKGQARRSKLPIIAAGVAIMAAVGFGGYHWMSVIQQSAFEADQQQQWEDAQAEGTRVAYERFIADNPQSPFLYDAQEARAALGPWSVVLGGDGEQRATAIATLNDAIVVGGYEAQGSTQTSGTVARLSLGGRLIWHQTFEPEDARDIQIHDVAIASDGSVFAVGLSGEQAGGPTDGFAARISADGDVIWRRTLGGTGVDRLNALILTNDTVLAVGATSSRGMGGLDGWRVLLDHDGNQLEEDTHGTPFDDSFTALAKDTQGNFVLGGYSTPLPDLPTNFWLLKLAASGATVFDRRPGGADIDRITDVTAHPDGRVVIVGETRSFGTQSYDGIILELTLDNRLPPKVIDLDRDDSFFSATALNDGDVLIVGQTQSRGAGQSDAWINRYSADLETLSWERVLGSAASDEAVDVVQLANGSIVFAGTTQARDTDGADIWIERMSASGGIETNVRFADPRQRHVVD